MQSGVSEYFYLNIFQIFPPVTFQASNCPFERNNEGPGPRQPRLNPPSSALFAHPVSNALPPLPPPLPLPLLKRSHNRRFPSRRRLLVYSSSSNKSNSSSNSSSNKSSNRRSQHCSRLRLKSNHSRSQSKPRNNRPQSHSQSKPRSSSRR